MTGVKSFLSDFVVELGPPVTFGDDAKGITKGYGTLQLGNVKIDKVSLVQGLKHNLLSISQICDKGFIVEFIANKVFIKHGSTKQVALMGTRQGNMYVAEWTTNDKETCLVARSASEKSWLWHRRLSHLNFQSINIIVRKGLVRGIPNEVFAKDQVCAACQSGKQYKASFPSIEKGSSSRILELLHMDLHGPVSPHSLNGRKYTLVVVDDYSRFTWVVFMYSKKETLRVLPKLLKQLSVEKSLNIVTIRSDRGT